jgi:hypothetical protein
LPLLRLEVVVRAKDLGIGHRRRQQLQGGPASSSSERLDAIDQKGSRGTKNCYNVLLKRWGGNDFCASAGLKDRSEIHPLAAIGVIENFVAVRQVLSQLDFVCAN